MKDILFLLGFLILLILGCYDYIKIFVLMKKYSKENIKIIFTISIGRHISIFLRLCLAIVCMVWGILYSRETNLLLGAACLFAMSGEFSHCYIGMTRKGILLNGRLIGYDDVKKYGSISMVTANRFEVCTPEYREYIYVKKDCDVINEILG